MHLLSTESSKHHARVHSAPSASLQPTLTLGEDTDDSAVDLDSSDACSLSLTTRRRWTVHAVESSSLPPSPATPFHYLSLPSQIESAGGSQMVVNLNPCLEFNEDQPFLDFDVSQPPSSLVPPEANPFYSIQSATYPELPSLAIIIPALPWPVIVHRSHFVPYVTVSDVVVAICSALRLPVDSTEDEQRDEGRLERATRLSMLRGHYKFLGLTKSDSENDTWVMHLREHSKIDMGHDS